VSIEVADGLSSSSHCAVTPPDVIIRPVSFAAIAAFSFVFVIPDTHTPQSPDVATVPTGN